MCQTILCEKTEKLTIFIPCPTEHPTIAHPTESDYLQTLFNEILFDYFSEYRDRVIINPIFNDTDKSKTFYPQTTSAHLEAILDIDYMKDYLWKYDVQISARDSGYNEITIKQEIGSAFYGFVSAVVSLVAGAISAAVEFAGNIIFYSSTTRRPHNVDS